MKNNNIINVIKFQTSLSFKYIGRVLPLSAAAVQIHEDRMLSWYKVNVNVWWMLMKAYEFTLAEWSEFSYRD